MIDFAMIFTAPRCCSSCITILAVAFLFSPVAAAERLEARSGALSQRPADLTTPLIVVRAPNNGTGVSPGGSVSVRIDQVPGVMVGEVLIFSGGEPQIVSLKSFPATASIIVPSDAAGEFPLVIVSNDPNGAFAQPIEITLEVVPTATLQSMDVGPTSVELYRPGYDLQVLEFRGHYSDGITRDVTHAQATTYTANDPTIATVSSGVVHAVANGNTSIVITNASYSITIPVTVDSTKALRCGNGVLDPGEECDPWLDQSGCCEAYCKFARDGRPCDQDHKLYGHCASGTCVRMPTSDNSGPTAGSSLAH